MGRDRSRSPRRKERRRSRSRERRPDESEKKLDKFGRDVQSRPDRHSGSRGPRDEGPPRRRDESRDFRRDDDRRVAGGYDRPSQSTSQDGDWGGDNRYGGADRAAGDGGYGDEQNDSKRQKVKEMIASQEDDVDEETKKMQQIMGIGGFDTTKNKKVTSNVGGYAKINRTQKYRQYMNRRGGFNRPLDWVQ